MDLYSKLREEAVAYARRLRHEAEVLPGTWSSDPTETFVRQAVAETVASPEWQAEAGDTAVDHLLDAFRQSEEDGYVLSVVTGEPVEPDHPDSPLVRAGCM